MESSTRTEVAAAHIVASIELARLVGASTAPVGLVIVAGSAAVVTSELAGLDKD